MAIEIGNGIIIEGGIELDTGESAATGAPFAIGGYWTAQGGYYAGAIQWPNGQIYDLVIAAKADRPSQSGYGFGQSQWSTTNTSLTVSPATAIVYSYDGAAATAAYSAAGFIGATGIQGVTINGFSDWYVPSITELYEVYRNLKPTTQDNSTFSRTGYSYSSIGITADGQNPRAVGGAFAATAGDPARTTVAAFQSGGAQAFSGNPYGNWHWTSTPVMASSGATTDSATDIFTLIFDWAGQGGGGSTTGFYQSNTKTNGYPRLPMRRIAR